MKRTLSAAAAIAWSLIVAGGAGRTGAQTPTTLVTNVTILDGRGSPPLTRAAVVIRDGEIASVLSQDDTRPAAATTLDGRGGYLLPGFVDMHAHLLFPRCVAGADGSIFDRAVSERMLSTLLDFGITTVRSPATPTVPGLRLRDDLNAGRVRGPRAFASAEFINDPDLSPAALRQVVLDALPYRPDYFKVYSRLPPSSISTVVAEAHAHGIPVIGHLGRTSWLEGARLGVDALTHAADWSIETLPPAARSAYETALRTRSPVRARIDWLELLDVSAEPVRAMADAIAQHGISIDPTLVAFDARFARPRGGRYATDPNVGIVPEMLSDWRACTLITADWTADDYRRWRAVYPKLQALTRVLRDRGVLLTTGTDLTNPWIIPGVSLHQEFELLSAAGFSAAEILKMTGDNAARALRRTDIGVIAPGRRADLVLLTANPLAAIRNTRRIAWVMQGGRVARGSLNAEF